MVLWVAIVRPPLHLNCREGRLTGLILAALGSMTGPAALQGVFGNRVSTGALALDGVMPITESVPLSSQLEVSGYSLIMRAAI